MGFQPSPLHTTLGLALRYRYLELHAEDADPSGSISGVQFTLCQCGCGYVSSSSSSLPLLTYRPHHSAPAIRFPCGAAKIPGPAALPPRLVELALLDAWRAYATGYDDPAPFQVLGGSAIRRRPCLDSPRAWRRDSRRASILDCVLAVAPLVGPCAPFTAARAARLQMPRAWCVG